MNGRVARLLAIGLVTGVAGGLLGVGGGFVMVPAMVYLMKTPQREANGTSLAVIVPVAIVGATILGGGHQLNVEIAIALAIGAVGGAVVGARLTRRSRAVARRSVTQKVLPCPTTLSAPISPPISSTRCLAMASPSPVPP